MLINYKLCVAEILKLYFNKIPLKKMASIVWIFLLVASAFAQTEIPIVEIFSGQILGRQLYTIGKGIPYYSFQGIPFAEPPVGNLRFMAPIEATKWNGILDATVLKAMCMQVSMNEEMDEDCLYINVYTPNLNETANLPVMVWIHGGGFFIGSSRSYKPDFFIDENVILVSFNYRLGVYGFLSTEDEVVPGNAGLKDQVLALHWVQKNIASFGGNPNSITIFGHSAGSASVSYLLQTPLTKGLFHRAIMQSGTSLNLWALARNKREKLFAAGSVLGLNITDSLSLVKSLQEADRTVLTVISLLVDFSGMVITNPRDGLWFSPSTEPEHKGAVITGKSHENLENGEFHQVPCLIGMTTFEALYFYPYVSLLLIYIQTYVASPSRFVPVDMNIQDSTLRQIVGAIIAAKSPVSTEEAVLRYISDDQFIRPIVETTRLLSKYVPVYQYVFSYEASPGKYGNISGVEHGAEIDLMFHSSTLTESARDTRTRLVRMWANFAKYDNPTPDFDEDLQNVTWPLATPDELTYLDIGEDLILKKDPFHETIRFWSDLYAQYGNPPYDTY